MQEIIDILLLYLFGVGIPVFFAAQCYALLANKKLKYNVKNIIILLLISFLVFLNNLFTILEIKAAISIIIMIIGLRLIFNDSFKKTFIIYAIVYIILSLLEITFSNIIFTFNLLSISAFTFTIVNYGFSIFLAVLEYLIIKISIIRNLLHKLINTIMSITTLINVFYLIIFTLLSIGVFNVYNNETIDSYKIIIVIIFIFTVVFIYLINTIVNSHILQLSNKKLLDYNEKYSKFLDEYKIYKHNIKNQLISIKSYGNKKVNALIDNLIEEETSFSLKNNNIYTVPNGIKGIVAEKLYNSEINVIIDNKIKKDPFKNLSPKAFNSISECLGIAIDNAIEASKETKGPIITIDLYENQESIFIKIGNNFCNDIDLEELGDKYYSTKNRGSGLGLFSIRRNNFVKENITIINNFYYIELQIKKRVSN